jgi:hypothetical protein
MLVATLLLAAGCSGDPVSTGAGESRMSARIDGAVWASDPSPASDFVTLVTPGAYLVNGQRLAGASSSAITLTLYNIRGPGTYPLGIGPTGVGGTAVLAEEGRGWLTPLSGASGTVTVSTVTATDIAGTFAFIAEPAVGGAASPRNVTEGRFDFPVRVNGSVGPLPDNAGSRLSATIGGMPWNAATIAASAVQSSILAIAASNTSRTLSLSLSGIDGPGTYTLSPTSPSRTITVVGPDGDPQGSNCCWGTMQGSTGSVTITSRTAARVIGTFSANLLPLPNSGATAPLVITSGTFDIGLP